ncbi:MAG: PEGA domain-containing protein [Vicinamibacterales bacterium]
MSVLSESAPGGGSGGKTPLIAGGLLVLALVAGVVYYRSSPAPRPEPDAPAAAVERPAPRPEPPPPAAEPAPEAPAPRPARRPAPRAEAPPPEPAAEAPTTATLTLTTDVPGASAFIDRQFVGKTPLTLEKLQPGPKRLNVSIEGLDAVERTVDLVPGPNDVELRFKEVRLNQRIPVVHKHRMGSCDGTLVATVDGLRYETTNKNDGFDLPYARVETFEVNYLDKNLRVKERGGRTWNFTDKNDNADNLFVFHREVTAAREKLAKGYTPVK